MVVAEHGGSRGGSVDGATAFALGRIEKQAALFQMNAAVGGIKGKNRYCSADAGDGVVGGDEFGTGTGTGAQDIRHFEKAIHTGGVLGIVGSGDDLDVVDDLGEFGFLEINCAESGEASRRCRRL